MSRSIEEEYAALSNPRPKPIHNDDHAVLNDSGLPVMAGRLYAMVNPAWPGIVKVGLSANLPGRLTNYQTGSPYRDYEMIAFSGLYLDARQAERDVHTAFDACRVEGSREWFKVTREQAIAAIGKGISVVDAGDDPFAGMSMGADPDDFVDT